MKKKRHKIKLANLSEAKPVRIISDSAIASCGIGEGKMIPLVILDTTGRPDIEQLIRIHENTMYGDAKTVWGELPSKKNSIALFIEFFKPSNIKVFIEFELPRQALTVDCILYSQALYIQPGREGDRLINAYNNPKLLIEIDCSYIREYWDKLYHKAVSIDFLNKGLPKREAQKAAIKLINELRKVANFRMSTLPDK